MVRARKTQIYPLQIAVNYWETRPSQMPSLLGQLQANGIRHVTAFIPWQNAECDIQHTLVRFLETIIEKKMSVSLVVSPEVGVSFPYSGLPKEIALDESMWARDRDGRPFIVGLPPVMHALPSWQSPELWKRYTQFLQKCEGWLADLARKNGDAKSRIQLILTGSYHKYYDSLPTIREFGRGTDLGDFSHSGETDFEESLKKLKQHPEFRGAFGKSSTFLASPESTEILRNRRNYEREKEFRARQLQSFKKTGNEFDFVQVEMLTPEADPMFLYSQVFSEVDGRFRSFDRLNDVATKFARVYSGRDRKEMLPICHWTGLGQFRTLSESERQFLLLKSLLTYGGRQGAVLIDQDEYFRLSKSFKKRLSFFADLTFERELTMEPEVLVLGSSPWIESGVFKKRSMMPGLGFAESSQAEELGLLDVLGTVKLVFWDDQRLLTSENLAQLMEWVKKGGTVAFPRTAAWSDLAQVEWKDFYDLKKGIETKMGAVSEILRIERGHWVFYDPPSVKEDWVRFFQATYSLAEVTLAIDAVSDVELLMLQRKRDEDRALFLMNPRQTAVESGVLFQTEMQIGDLLEAYRSPDQINTVTAKQCDLEIPAFGVLPLTASGFGSDEFERKIAENHRELNPKYAEEAARTVLPGFAESDWGL